MHRELRIVADCRVTFAWRGETIRAHTENISRRGTFVCTDASLPVSAVVALRIELPDGKRVVVQARAVHTLSSAAARVLNRRLGVGFEFLELDEEGRDAIGLFLDTVQERVSETPRRVPPGTGVLVVAADASERARVVRVLTDEGFAVHAASSGGEAYSSFLAHKPAVALVAADLPVMDGRQLAQLIATRSPARTRVVLITGADADLYYLRTSLRSVVDFVHRPFTDEELRTRVFRAAIADSEERDLVMFRGKLGDIELRTFLSLLEFERKSGQLTVRQEDQQATLSISAGRIVRIEGPGPFGAPAERVFAVLSWRHGSLEFASGTVYGPDELGVSMTELLLEHARRIDEAARR